MYPRCSWYSPPERVITVKTIFDSTKTFERAKMWNEKIVSDKERPLSVHVLPKETQ